MFATLQANFAGFDVPLAKRLRISPRKRQRVLESELSQQINRSRLLFLGDSRAGKTSTVRSLTGEEFDLDLARTRGIETCFVDEKWRSVADSKLCDAETIEAKLVAEELTKRESCRVSVERSAHDKYRTIFNNIFLKLWLCTGRSNLVTALIFYGLVFFVVHLIGLWKIAVFDLAIFLVLTSRRQTAYYSEWLSILRGFLIGIVVGQNMSHLVVSFLHPCTKSSYLTMVPVLCKEELVTCLILIATPEIVLLLGNKTRFKMPRIWNILEMAELSSRDLGKFFHSAMLGAALSMAGLQEIPGFQLVICNMMFTSIFVLRVFILKPVAIVRDIFLSTGLLTELAVVIWHLVNSSSSCSNTNSFNFAAIFFIFDLLLHSYASVQYQKEAVSLNLYDSVLNPPKSLVIARDLLDSKLELQKAIAEIQEMKLQLVDFAGDDDYYCYHHIFLTDEALYGVVFNITLLVGTTQDEFKQVIKRLRFWLESICIHSSAECAVFLIATHCDGITNEQLIYVDGCLRCELWKPFMDNFIVNDHLLFFTVNNSNGPADDGICKLRQKVLHVAKNDCRLFEKKVPLPWIKLEDKILEMRKKESTTLCVPLDKFKDIAIDKPCMVEEQHIPEVLDYLYKKGLVMTTKDLGWVLIEPRLLTDIVIQLITQSSNPEFQERLYRKDWQILRDRGMLTSNLLSKILSKFDDGQEAIKAFLQEYNIICLLMDVPSYQKENITHLVPALLPKSPHNKPVWIVQPDDAKFYVSFERFLPEAVFHCLMAKAYKHNKLLCPTSYPDLKSNDGQFWLDANQPYRLTLLREEKLVEVTLCRYCITVYRKIIYIVCTDKVNSLFSV